MWLPHETKDYALVAPFTTMTNNHDLIKKQEWLFTDQKAMFGSVLAKKY